MSYQQQTIRNSKRNSPKLKYNYIQTEPDEMETFNQVDEFVRDGNSSLDKHYVGISISDSINENQCNDKPQQIPKIKQIRHSKHIMKTLPDLKSDDNKKKIIKTKVTKFYMDEQRKYPKVVQYKLNTSHLLVEKPIEKPILKTQRVIKNNTIKKTIDLNNSIDDHTDEQLSMDNDNQSLYDQALQSIQPKNKKIKSLKTDLVRTFDQTCPLNSERQPKPTVFSFNLRPFLINASEEQFQSPQKAGSMESEMDDQNSDIVVNKIKTQSIDKNKFMRTHDIKISASKKLGLKPQTSLQNVSGLKNIVSPQKNSAIKNKAQNPVRPQKTNSNNIGQLHHSKSNSLSINQSMKIIPKIKTVIKKVENKKIVQFQSKPIPKKAPLITGNSFKNATQRKMEARPISSGPNNQQKSINFVSGNNQDRVFPPEQQKPLTQRTSLIYNTNQNDLEKLSILKKTSSKKSPISVRTQSINQQLVNMAVDQQFLGLPQKIVLPSKNQFMFKRLSGINDSYQTQSSRRDRSQTYHQPSSFNAGELQPEAKAHRLDKQQPKVHFQEHPHPEKNFRKSNQSVTSDGVGSKFVPELSCLKLMRDHKKNSKSLLKNAFNQSETELNLGGKLAEIQNQLNQLSELSAHDRGSNHDSYRNRSTSFRKPGHSTSQRNLVKEVKLQNISNLPQTAETPQPSRFQIRIPSKNAFSIYNQHIVDPSPMNNFNNTTKKVMIDLSSNPDYAKNIQPQFSGYGEIDDDYEQSLEFVDNFQGSLNMFKNKSHQPRNVQTAMQQPTMMSGGYNSYHQQPDQSALRNGSKSGRRNQMHKHDSMTEKLSRELLQQFNPDKNFQSGESEVRKSEKFLNNSGQRQSSSQTRINKKGNLLFQKKQGAGVNFKQLQNELEV